MSIVSSVLFPDFPKCLFLSRVRILFLIRMLLLDLLPTKLILSFKIFQTNFNDNLRSGKLVRQSVADNFS